MILRLAHVLVSGTSLLAAVGAFAPRRAVADDAGARSPDAARDAPVASDHHHSRDRVPHGDTDAYIARLESSERDAWQRPAELVAALQIQPGARVADVGTGSGYFLPHLSRAVGADGFVVGEDIDEGLLAYARTRVSRERLGNVQLRTGTPHDPRLEVRRYDVVLVVDAFHHFVNRRAMLDHLRESLAPGGRLVIVEFADGNLPVGPPPGHKLPRERVERELREAELDTLRDHGRLLPYQYVLELGARSEARLDETVGRPTIRFAPNDPTPIEVGFPAVSRDGATVVSIRTDGADLFAGRVAVFTRVSDGTVLREEVLATAAELDAEPARAASANRRVRERAARIERTLREAGYRTQATTRDR